MPVDALEIFAFEHSQMRGMDAPQSSTRKRTCNSIIWCPQQRAGIPCADSKSPLPILFRQHLPQGHGVFFDENAPFILMLLQYLASVEDDRVLTSPFDDSFVGRG